MGLTATPGDKLPTCCTLWIGGDLSPIASACLASFVRRGHPVVLYCYDLPENVPAGIEIADANPIVPAERIFRHTATGSYAIFSDLFRYELLRLGRGIWIDCDVYCVRPMQLEASYVYGWQRPGSINCAILRLPADSPVLERLIKLFMMKSPVVPWLDHAVAAALQAKRMAGGEFSVADLPWGASVPEGLTYLLTEAGLARHAPAMEVFYPLPWNQGPLLFRAGTDLRSFIRPRTLTVHLWNETVSHHLDKVERGSPIDRLRTQGTLFDEALLAGATP